MADQGMSHPQTNLPTTITDRNQPMTIKNLIPRLAERGKIKLGMRGPQTQSQQGKAFPRPVKLDHFRVVTMQRGQDGNYIRDDRLHEMLGDKPMEIPVRLLYDDPALNFQSSYACYRGRTLWCRGDGNEASRLGDDGKRFYVPCTCERAMPDYKGQDRCKMNGKLSVIIDGAEIVGSIWSFRTTSYHSINNITSALRAIRTVSGGVLAGVLLFLTVRAQQATAPDGAQQTIYVASLEYRGTESSLRQLGVNIALERATAHLRIEHIEDEARRFLLPAPDDAPLPGDDADDIVEEFYPEQAEAAPVVAENAPPRPTRESVKTEIAEAQAKQPEREEPVFEFYDAQGEGPIAFSDPAKFMTKFVEALGVAEKAKDELAIGNLADNNGDTIKTLPDRGDEAYEAVSMAMHNLVQHEPQPSKMKVGR
jgi:hypothetical protein